MNNKKKFLVDLAYLIAVLALIYIGLKYVVPVIKPFIIGFIIAFLLKKPSIYLSKKTGISKENVGRIILALLYVAIVSIIIFGGNSAYEYINNLVTTTPKKYYYEIVNFVNTSFDSIKSVIDSDGGHLGGIIASMEKSVYSAINSISNSLVGSAAGYATTIPRKIVNLVFVIITSFFFTGDYDRIVKFILEQLPTKKRELILGIKKETIDTISNYLKAYGKIILITSIELIIGLLILRIKGAIWIGIVIAIIDIVPVLGTGTIMIPWAIFSFASGNYIRCLGLIIIYAVVTVIRQVMEPKIVSGSIGLHPILTLFGMFVGTKLFGFWGLFLLPISFTVIKNLNEKGYIHLYNKPEYKLN